MCTSPSRTAPPYSNVGPAVRSPCHFPNAWITSHGLDSETGPNIFRFQVCDELGHRRLKRQLSLPAETVEVADELRTLLMGGHGCRLTVVGVRSLAQRLQESLIGLVA
jgi:hypothetical protein